MPGQMCYFVKTERAVNMSCASHDEFAREVRKLESDGFREVGRSEYEVVRLIEEYGAAFVYAIAAQHRTQ